MKYSPYSEYKTTRCQWLKSVPKHWKDIRFRNLFRFVSGGTPSTTQTEYWNGDIPWVSSKDMKSFLLDDTADHITKIGVEESSTTLIPPMSLVMVVRSGILRHSLPVSIAVRQMAINQDIRAFVPIIPEVNVTFVAYFILGHQSQLLTLWRQQGATVESLDFETVKAALVVAPPLEEQTAIASFLDRETGRIDALISKQRELIELLGEKRRALISRCVTRGLPPAAAEAAGLDPHPKLKPTGIDWLGDVPEHWEVSSVGRIAKQIQTGPFGSKLHQRDYVEDGIPLVNPAHIVNGRIVPDAGQSVDEMTKRRLAPHILKAGDIIFARRGEIGRCAEVGEIESGWLCGTGCLVLELADDDSKYYATLFKNSGFADALELNAVGTTMLNINPAILSRADIPRPPREEQTAIANFLDAETAKLDRLVSKAEEMIDRLHEYRTALITAAVTGKIDVRGEVPNDETQNEPVSATSTGVN